jgi:hypothetical protein
MNISDSDEEANIHKEGIEDEYKRVFKILNKLLLSKRITEEERDRIVRHYDRVLSPGEAHNAIIDIKARKKSGALYKDPKFYGAYGMGKKKGGAKLSERGLASFLREKYYFGANESVPAYVLYQFLSAVIHSPNTKPMPSHPFNILLEGNEASAERALAEIVRANGWQRYVKDNTTWGKDLQGYAIIPPAPAGASASAGASAPAPYVAPSAPWASAGKRRADPGGGVSEPPPPPPATGLSLDMAEAGLGDDEDEEEGELGEVAPPPPPPPPPVAQPAEAGDAPKPKAKKAKPESKEVDFDAEALASKMDFFKEVERGWIQKVNGVSLDDLHDIFEEADKTIQRIQPQAIAMRKQREALGKLKATLRSQYNALGDKIRETGLEGKRRGDLFNAELDELKKDPPDYAKRKRALDAEREAIEQIRSRLAQMKSEAETMKGKYDDVVEKDAKLDTDLEALDNQGVEAERRGRKAKADMAKNPANRLVDVLRQKGWLDEYNAWAKRDKSGEGRYRGKGKPTNSALQLIAKEAYKPNPSQSVGQYRLLSATPTLKFYKSGNTVVVGVRGTVPSDIEDVKADGLIALNKLETSNRYKKDIAELSRVRSSLPGDEFYGVGHSLGGAILDAFLHTGMIKSGVSYNSAVQPKDFNSNIPIHRIYQKGDPLYALGKNFLQNAPEVREAKPKSWKDRLISLVPYAGSVYNYLDAHNLSNFDGGGKSAVSPTPSNPLSREEYLSRVRAKAKSEGYPYKLLGYADDSKHKFQIPNADGKIIRFGRDGYGDFHIWSALEASGKVAKGYAENKRKVFHNSHNKIKGRWRSDLFSPNNLALKILW